MQYDELKVKIKPAVEVALAKMSACAFGCTQTRSACCLSQI